VRNIKKLFDSCFFSKRLILSVLLCYFYSLTVNAQVFINEIQADAGQSEGQNEAFIELKTGGSSVDLNCWVLTNGKWAIRFPSVIISANSHFVIGCGEDASSSGAGTSASEPGGPTSGLTCDICDFPGLPLGFDVCDPINGTFYDPSSNGFSIDAFSDQIVLFDDDGNIVDAVKINAGDPQTNNYVLGSNIGADDVPFVPNPDCGNVVFEMPALSSNEYQAFSGSGTDQCNRSLSLIGNSWSINDHPTPGADNSSITWGIKVQSNGGTFQDLENANLVFCSTPDIVIRLEVYNYQHVEPNSTDHSNNTGSYIFNPITNNEDSWTVVSTGDTNNGTTVFEYSIGNSAFPGLGLYRFQAFWDDFTHLLGSGVVPPSSQSNCYEKENVDIRIVQPLSVSDNDISCPEDFNQGVVDIGSLVTGGYQNTYELYDNMNNVIDSNPFGIFSIANASQGDFVVKIINGVSSNCAPLFIEVDVSENCAAEPPCPENMNLTVNASNPVCSDTDIQVCFEGEALPLGGTVNLYMTDAAETDYLNGILIETLEIADGSSGGTSFDLTWNFDSGDPDTPFDVGGGAVSGNSTFASSSTPPKKSKGGTEDTETCLFQVADFGQCFDDYPGDQSLAVCNWSATNIDFAFNASYLEFCFDIGDCGLSVQEISFDMGRSNDGPENVWVTQAVEADPSKLLDGTSPRILGTHYQGASACAPVVIPNLSVLLQANDNWCFYIYVHKDTDAAASFDCEPPTSAGMGCRRIYLDDVKITLVPTCNDPSMGVPIDECIDYTIDQDICDGGNDYKIWSVVSPFGDNCPDGGADDATAILTEPITVSCPSLSFSETFVEVCEGDNQTVSVTVVNGISGTYQLSYFIQNSSGTSAPINAVYSGGAFVIPIETSTLGLNEYVMQVFTDGVCATNLVDLGFTVQVYATDDVSITGSTDGNCTNPGSVTLDFGNNASPPWTVNYEIDGISYEEDFFDNPTTISITESGIVTLISAFNSTCEMGIGTSTADIDITGAPEITADLTGGATIFVDGSGNPTTTIDLSVYEVGTPLGGSFCWYYVDPNDPAFNEASHLIVDGDLTTPNEFEFSAAFSTTIYLVHTVNGTCGDLGKFCFALEPLEITVSEVAACAFPQETAGIAEAPMVTEICFVEPSVDFAASPGYGTDPLQAGTTDFLYLIYGPNSTSDIFEINFDGAFTAVEAGIYYVAGIEVDYVSMQSVGIDINTITTEGDLLMELNNNNICSSTTTLGYQLSVCPESEINFNNVDGTSVINVCGNLGSIDLTELVLEDPANLTFNINPPNLNFDLTGTVLTFPTDIVGSETVTIEIVLTPFDICSTCPTTETIQLNVFEEIKAIDATICEFGTSFMLGIENPPPGATNFIWYDDEGNELATTTNSVITDGSGYFAVFGTPPPEVSTDFEVEIVGGNYYCQENISVSLTVNEQPNAGDDNTTATICNDGTEGIAEIQLDDLLSDGIIAGDGVFTMVDGPMITSDNMIDADGLNEGDVLTYQFTIAGTEPCNDDVIDIEITVEDCVPCTVFGCTDPDFCNFDSTADCDDGSCSNDDPGTCNTDCTMGDVEEWDSVNCECTVLTVSAPGCVDATACNYDPDATCDDGSCSNDDPGTCNTDCTMGDVEEWDSVNCECTVLTVSAPGCVDATACNYDPDATCDDGSCSNDDPGTCNTDCTMGDITIWDAATCSCVFDSTPILGCNDPVACNFDATATCDDGTCTFGDPDCDTPGCIDPCAPNFDPLANVDDDSCEPYDTTCNSDCTLGDITIWDAVTCSCVVQTPTVLGCMDATACNYDINANCDDGSCNSDDPGTCNSDCTLGDITIWDAATCSCVFDSTPILGCTDPVACNFDATATCDDGTCTFGDPDCDTPGCIDPCAPNFDPLANVDDDSCEPYDTTCNSDCTLGDITIWDAVTCSCVVQTPTVLGCMDATACNYDINANCDDGSCNSDDPGTCNSDCTLGDITIWDAATCSCVFDSTPILGCTDPVACNFDATATCDDGTCTFGDPDCDTPGCIDPCAPNFDPLANVDDDSCEPYDTTCNSDCTLGDITIWDAVTCSCVVQTPTVLGCMDATACNYDINANCDDGSCNSDDPGTCNSDCTLGDITIWDAATCSCVFDSTPILGCTDPVACNFDATATCDDGTCTFGDPDCDTPGCIDPCAPNFDPLANVDDDSCEPYDTTCNSDCTLGDITIWDAVTCSCVVQTPTVLGCMDATACNYDINANCDDGSCNSDDPGTCNSDCTLGDITIWDAATCSCVFDSTPILGCTDPVACNFDATATCDDGTCTFGDPDCDTPGCIDPCAPNFDPLANVDDDSCEPYDTTCNSDCTLGDITIWDAVTCSCVVQTPTVLGCMDATACNYDINANCDDGSCNSDDPGTCNSDCTLGDITIWDAATCSCVFDSTPILGCTDPVACNFDATATCDDGTCTFGDPDCDTPGCIDPCAPNFDPLANVDDDSCEPYDTTCNSDCTLGDITIWDAVTCSCVVQTPTVLGCMDATACNYDINANCDDGSCNSDDPGTCNSDCTLGDITIWDAATCSCVFDSTPILGCTDPVACNFDATATCDDGTCTFGDPDCDTPGCIDPCAPNFDPLANVDDDSCEPYDTTCNSDCTLGDITIWDAVTCSCVVQTPTVLGCMDATACNYDINATCDDGSCSNDDPGTCNSDCTLGDITIWDAATCSCVFDSTPILGCNDPVACNFDATATCDDGTCTFGDPDCDTPGCIDPCAPNFDPLANVDDDSCEPYDTTCNSDCTLGDITIWDAVTCSCVVQTPTVLGCMDATACNYDINANCDDGSCNSDDPGTCNSDCTLGDITIWDAATCSCVFDSTPILGCTDPVACNFDATATCDDGTCTFGDPDCDTPGCIDPCAPNFDPLANVDDDSCEPYDTTCNTDCTMGDVEEWDSASCDCVVLTITEAGCTDATACNYDVDANCDDLSCDYGNAACPVTPCDCSEGCMDPCALNYDPDASLDDGTCEPYDTTCNTDCTIGSIEEWDAATCECVEISIPILGCIDATACNYDATADCDNGTCVYEIACDSDPCTNGGIFNWNDANCECELAIPTVLGCTDINACNYDVDATCDDDSCQAPNPICTDPCDPDCIIEGCTDSCAPNYDPTATQDNGTCEPYDMICNSDCTNGNIEEWDAATCSCVIFSIPTPGCLDETACNYNPIADCDNSSCDFGNPICDDPCDPTCQILGCTNPCAENFNATATADDGSCIVNLPDAGLDADSSVCNFVLDGSTILNLNILLTVDPTSGTYVPLTINAPELFLESFFDGENMEIGTFHQYAFVVEGLNGCPNDTAIITIDINDCSISCTPLEIDLPSEISLCTAVDGMVDLNDYVSSFPATANGVWLLGTDTVSNLIDVSLVGTQEYTYVLIPPPSDPFQCSFIWEMTNVIITNDLQVPDTVPDTVCALGTYNLSEITEISRWYSDFELQNELLGEDLFAPLGSSVFGIYSDGDCTSEPFEIYISMVPPTPPPFAESEICFDGSYDLSQLGDFNWYTDQDLTNPVTDLNVSTAGNYYAVELTSGCESIVGRLLTLSPSFTVDPAAVTCQSASTYEISININGDVNAIYDFTGSLAEIVGNPLSGVNGLNTFTAESVVGSDLNLIITDIQGVCSIEINIPTTEVCTCDLSILNFALAENTFCVNGDLSIDQIVGDLDVAIQDGTPDNFGVNYLIVDSNTDEILTNSNSANLNLNVINQLTDELILPETYCMYALVSNISEGLTLGATINDIANDAGVNISDGACIALSPCIDIEVLEVPAAPTLNSSFACTGMTGLFDLTTVNDEANWFEVTATDTIPLTDLNVDAGYYFAGMETGACLSEFAEFIVYDLPMLGYLPSCIDSATFMVGIFISNPVGNSYPISSDIFEGGDTLLFDADTVYVELSTDIASYFVEILPQGTNTCQGSLLIESLNCECTENLTIPPQRNICSTQDTLDLNDLRTPDTGEGIWTVTSFPTDAINLLVIDGDMLLSSNVTVGEYELTFTLTNPIQANCDTFSTQSITVVQGPNSGTAMDILPVLCTGEIDTVDLFSLLDLADIGGSWTLTSGTLINAVSFDAVQGIFYTENETEGDFVFSYTIPADGNCPAASTEIALSIGSSTDLLLAFESNVCNNASGNFTLNFNDLILTGPLNGSWSEITNSGAIPENGTNTYNFLGVQEGTYQFEYTLLPGEGCSNLAQTLSTFVVVEECMGCIVPEVPTAISGQTIEICLGDSFETGFTLANDNPFISVDWYSTSDANAPVGSGLTFVPPLAGSYYPSVFMTDNDTCKSDTIIIFQAIETSNFTVEIDGRNTITSGEFSELEVLINPPGDYNIVWDENVSGLDDYNSIAPNASPSQETTYTVTVSDDTGCSQTASITIGVEEIVCPANVAICNLIVSPSVTNGNSVISFYSNHELMYTARLYSRDGVLHRKETGMTEIGFNDFDYDINYLPPGMYIFSLELLGDRLYKKVIKVN